MATINDALAVAFQHHQAGRLETAEQAYRLLLQREPQHPDAWHLLGLLASQRGQHQAAVDCIRRAIEASPSVAAFHSNLGLVFRQLQQVDAAVACFRRAVELQPNFAEAHSHLGHTFKVLRRPEEAEIHYRRVVELNPANPEAHHDLANVLQWQRKLKEAVACYQRAVELKPTYAAAWTNLGTAWQEQREFVSAEACYRQALQLRPDDAVTQNNFGAVLLVQKRATEAATYCSRATALNPDYVEAHANLGAALQEQGRLAEAVGSYRRALELNPTYAPALANMGTAYEALGNLDEAVHCYQRALELSPDFAEARTHLGIAYQLQGKLEQAASCYDGAIQLKPDYVEAHFVRSGLWLLQGEFRRGWPEFEWCWQRMTPRPLPQPRWQGESLTGRTILLHVEQGYGDTIHFVRYALQFKRAGARVIVECKKALIPLLRTCPAIDGLVANGDPLPPFDCHAPLMSLPDILKTDLTNLPAEVPYLFVDAAQVERWRSELKAKSGEFKVGINWQGNPNTKRDRYRSIPLDHFAPLARCKGVQLFSLQKGSGSEQLREFASSSTVIDMGARLNDFADTAAVMKNLDLVITSDTAMAHLAGALGIPVWVVLSFVPDWRWLMDRDDCPWYPTMRLFRQRRFGDWAGVFEEVRAALAARCTAQIGN